MNECQDDLVFKINNIRYLYIIAFTTLLLGGCQDKKERYQTTGLIESRLFYVKSPQGGELTRLYVSEGEAVKKGQRVAKVKGQRSLKAPDKGRVTETFYQQKEYVSPGSAIASLLLPDQIYTIFYVPEKYLNRIQLNKVVTIRYRDHDYPAKILFIASEAEYTPDSLYQSENRHKSVFKIKTELPKQLKSMVKVGQSVEVIYD